MCAFLPRAPLVTHGVMAIFKGLVRIDATGLQMQLRSKFRHQRHPQEHSLRINATLAVSLPILLCRRRTWCSTYMQQDPQPELGSKAALQDLRSCWLGLDCLRKSGGRSRPTKLIHLGNDTVLKLLWASALRVSTAPALPWQQGHAGQLSPTIDLQEAGAAAAAAIPSIPTRLNSIPHSREARQHFYQDAAQAVKNALVAGKTRLTVRLGFFRCTGLASFWKMPAPFSNTLACTG